MIQQPSRIVGAILVLLLIVLCAFVVQQLSSTWILLGAHPEVLDELEQSLDELKDLAELSPEEEAARRRSFDRRQRLLQRLHILDSSRERLSGVVVAFVVALIVLVAACAWVLHLLAQRRRQRQLDRLTEGLEALTLGTAPRLDDVRGGTVGEVARRIERASATVGEERRRLQEMEQLETWRDGARRLGHEMRTPLTAIQLDLQKLGDRARADETTDSSDALWRTVDRLQTSFGTLQRFLKRFTASARLPKPRPVVVDLRDTVRGFASAFDRAWPHLVLETDDSALPPGEVLVLADKEALRQILVNLIRNSWRAAAPSESKPVTVTLRLRISPTEATIDVIDDGPGLDDDRREHIFLPYVSSDADHAANDADDDFSDGSDGKELGLGLAISRMLALQQGGSLTALASEAARELGGGAVFRLTLPIALPHAPPTALPTAHETAVSPRRSNVPPAKP